MFHNVAVLRSLSEQLLNYICVVLLWIRLHELLTSLASKCGVLYLAYIYLVEPRSGYETIVLRLCVSCVCLSVRPR